MIVFWTLVGVDGLAAAVILYFLLEGLRDGSVSSDNALIWLLLVAWPAAALGGGFLLRSHGKLRLANIVLMLLAGPALLCLLLLLLVLIVQPDFR